MTDLPQTLRQTLLWAELVEACGKPGVGSPAWERVGQVWGHLYESPLTPQAESREGDLRGPMLEWEL